MGGEGIAAAHGWEGTRGRLCDQTGRAGGVRSGHRGRSAGGAAVVARLAAGQQVQALGREPGLGAARRRHRAGHFIDLDRAKGFHRRDFSGRPEVELEFHVNSLFTLDCCGAASFRVPLI